MGSSAARPSPHSSRVESILDLIGNTPLIRLRRSAAHLPSEIEVYIKAEWFNPGGSVKDRAARGIIVDAMNRGKLREGGTLLDASSGNTGIAYAMLGAALGFEVVLCIPENANPERKKTLLAYGANLVYTDPHDGSDGAILKARSLVAEDPERYFYADQYSNDSNWRAHYESTGPELVAQTEGRLTHFVSGLGTSGTCMGTGRFLRDHSPHTRIIAFQPDGPLHGLEGMKHMESAIVPPIYAPEIPHENRACVTEDAYETCRRLARLEGMFLGISAGAAATVALRVAAEQATAGSPAVIVALGCDGGSRYLSEHFWDTSS